MGAGASHVYAAGVYRATLRVSDGKGGVATDAVTVTVSSKTSFPSAPVLDNFNRSSGALGAQWLGAGDAEISSKHFKPKSSKYIATIWGAPALGADQEAYVTLYDVTSSGPRQGLLMKVQGESVEAGGLEVRYDGAQRKVLVASYTPGRGWEDRGGLSVKLGGGDVLGARAFANGLVEVYRNKSKLGTVSVADWIYADRGGRIGLTLQNATSTRFDDFGGGNWVVPPAASASNAAASEDDAEVLTPVPPAPGILELAPSVPNPFRKETTIRFALPVEGPVSLDIFDVQGRHLAALVHGGMRAGWQSARWDGRDAHGDRMRAGVYFARLEWSREIRVQRVVLAR